MREEGEIQSHNRRLQGHARQTYKKHKSRARTHVQTTSQEIPRLLMKCKQLKLAPGMFSFKTNRTAQASNHVTRMKSLKTKPNHPRTSAEKKRPINTQAIHRHTNVPQHENGRTACKQNLHMSTNWHSLHMYLQKTIWSIRTYRSKRQEVENTTSCRKSAQLSRQRQVLQNSTMVDKLKPSTHGANCMCNAPPPIRIPQEL